MFYKTFLPIPKMIRKQLFLYWGLVNKKLPEREKKKRTIKITNWAKKKNTNTNYGNEMIFFICGFIRSLDIKVT